ncbi:hypothetical protein [uncultured Parabacteroides sp.]|nr:hypothetical protein [uncultured Parabacteroides sp.]
MYGGAVGTFSDDGLEQLEEVDNVIRLSNPKETGPDVDKIEVVMKVR